MEEPDGPPVQSGQKSVSVQCSPSKTDAATQTHIDPSDAAVQRPADVHNPVTTDHVDAGQHEIELVKQVEEDGRSQDLFLSDDEFSEVSQPRYGQSDPEYNAS